VGNSGDCAKKLGGILGGILGPRYPTLDKSENIAPFRALRCNIGGDFSAWHCVDFVRHGVLP